MIIIMGGGVIYEEKLSDNYFDGFLFDCSNMPISN